jgi:hypothetical protein
LNANAYVEFGLFESLTLITNLSYKGLTSKRSELLGGGSATRIVTINTVGLSDIALSGRYLLLHRPFVLSFQGGAKIPVGYEKTPSDDGPPLGTGNLDLDAHLLFGKSMFPLPAYVTTSIGYRWRSGALHDQILFTAEGGYSFGPVLVKVNLDALKSTIAPPDIVGQPITTPLPGGGGVFPNIIQGDQDSFKLSPSIIVNLTNRIAMQGEILHTIAGKNTVAGTIYSFGVIYTR